MTDALFKYKLAMDKSCAQKYTKSSELQITSRSRLWLSKFGPDDCQMVFEKNLINFKKKVFFTMILVLIQVVVEVNYVLYFTFTSLVWPHFECDMWQCDML